MSGSSEVDSNIIQSKAELSFCVCLSVILSVQPPPTGPGFVGPSLPGGAAVPCFTPLLLQ